MPVWTFHSAFHLLYVVFPELLLAVQGKADNKLLQQIAAELAVRFLRIMTSILEDFGLSSEIDPGKIFQFVLFCTINKIM